MDGGIGRKGERSVLRYRFMTKQTRLRTSEIRVNKNLSVPIGNLFWTEAFFEHFGLYDHIRGMKSKGTDLGKLAELMVSYKTGDNFSILRCHEYALSPPIREHTGLPEFDVRGLYRAVEILGENRENIITHFRRTFLSMYGPELTDMVFDRTSLVYFGSEPDLAMRGYSRDGYPEECQIMVGISQPAKPPGVSIGMTVMPGNTNDGKHMRSTYEQVKEDLTKDSMMIFDAGANRKDILDIVVRDGKHFITRKRLNKSDDKIFAKFSKEEWGCIDEEKGEYCLKKIFPSRVNYCFFSEEWHEPEMRSAEKRIPKELKEAKDLQKDLEKGKKLKKRYRIENILIKATISLQTRLSEITDEEAVRLLEAERITGREGFLCLVSDRDMDPRKARELYRSKDIVGKLFSSMKSDIGIISIRTWTENGVYGVLLIGFLAQAMASVTRFLTKPASSTATKFITNSMHNLTLTVETGADGRRRRSVRKSSPWNGLKAFSERGPLNCQTLDFSQFQRSSCQSQANGILQ